MEREAVTIRFPADLLGLSAEFCPADAALVKQLIPRLAYVREMGKR